MAGVSVVQINGSTKVLQTANGINDRQIIILRKTPHHHILPQTKDFTTIKDEILITNTGKKKSKGKELRTTPQPMAVARRNARERNRVKQVNNGFANLRQHIPNFIAAAFESNARGGNKKLSKVETLRMAVEYIRSLEDLLADEGSSSSFSSPSGSDLSTPPPSQQFTYQIIPGNLYDDSENLEPLDVNDDILSDTGLIDADLELLENMHSGGDSLSPGMYSEQSSPGDVKCENVPVISLKTENDLPQQHMDVIQWWEQQQSPHSS